MQRRDFLMASVGGILTAGVSGQDRPKLEIIDTHTHFYDPTRPQGVPWPGKNDKALIKVVNRPSDYYLY